MQNVAAAQQASRPDEAINRLRGGVSWLVGHESLTEDERGRLDGVATWLSTVNDVNVHNLDPTGPEPHPPPPSSRRR